MARSLYSGRRHHQTGESRSEAKALGREGLNSGAHQASYPSHRGESTVLSFVSWLTLSGTEQSSVRGPSTENQEAKRVALDCIKVTACLPLVNKSGPLPTVNGRIKSPRAYDQN